MSHYQDGVYPLLATGELIPLALRSISFVVALSTLFHLSLLELENTLQESAASFCWVVVWCFISSIPKFGVVSWHSGESLGDPTYDG